MYKNIVPGLVSFDSSLEEMKAFVMCQDFNFFPAQSHQSPFHYTVKFAEDCAVPSEYEVRSEYFVKKNDSWYFDRRVFFWHPYLQYDFRQKIFSFNRSYYNLPFRLGGIFALGEHLANIIELDLFLRDFLVLRGIAFRQDGKVIGVSAPGMNGKSTLLKKMMRQGGEYIAEDYLIINLEKRLVYPTCPLTRENFWRGRKISRDFGGLIRENTILQEPVALDTLYLAENSLAVPLQTGERTFLDFVLLNSLYFMNNLFTRSYIYEQGLSGQVADRIETLRSYKEYTFVSVKNFDYNLS